MTGNVGAVFLFEWRRALALPRLAWWVVLASFPVFIVMLIRITVQLKHGNHPLQSMGQPQDIPPREFWVGFLFALIPMLLSMLGTLLWTTPAISSELERRSWVYLAVRPHGGAAVLLGKYLVAVTWVIPAAIAGLTVAVPLAGTGDGWRIWWTMVRLVCLSCPAYAAVYLVLGTLMPRRAMVLAVAYSLIFELVISFVPAVINKLTIQFRLRALLVEWGNLPIGGEPELLLLLGDAPAWQHVLVLIGLVPTLLVVAIALLRHSEFSSAAESDV